MSGVAYNSSRDVKPPKTSTGKVEIALNETSLFGRVAKDDERMTAKGRGGMCHVSSNRDLQSQSNHKIGSSRVASPVHV